MPLIRITLAAGKSAAYRQAIGDGIHRALVAALRAPADDRFQIITEVPAEGLVYDPAYLGIRRDGDLVIIQAWIRRGRDVAMKQEFYRQVAANLAADPGIAPGNIFISLHENGVEDWSFGNGEAQYVLNPPPALAKGQSIGVGKIAKTVASFYGLAFLTAGALLLLRGVATEGFDAALHHLLPLQDLAALAGFSA